MYNEKQHKTWSNLEDQDEDELSGKQVPVLLGVPGGGDVSVGVVSF